MVRTLACCLGGHEASSGKYTPESLYYLFSLLSLGGDGVQNCSGWGLSLCCFSCRAGGLRQGRLGCAGHPTQSETKAMVPKKLESRLWIQVSIYVWKQNLNVHKSHKPAWDERKTFARGFFACLGLRTEPDSDTPELLLPCYLERTRLSLRNLDRNHVRWSLRRALPWSTFSSSPTKILFHWGDHRELIGEFQFGKWVESLEIHLFIDSPVCLSVLILFCQETFRIILL